MFITKYRRKLFISVTVSTAVIILILFFSLRILVQKQSTNENLKSVMREIRTTNSSVQLLSQAVTMLIDDTREIRETISMSERDYSFIQKQNSIRPENEETEIDKEEPEKIKGFFQALNRIQEEDRIDKLTQDYLDFIESDDFNSLLEDHNLSLKKNEPRSSIIFKEEKPFFSITINDKGNFNLYAFSGLSISFSSVNPRVRKFIQDAINNKSDTKEKNKQEDPWVTELVMEIKKIQTDGGFLHTLKENGYRLDTSPRMEEEYLFFDFHDSQNEIVGSIGYQLITGRAFVFDKSGIPLESIEVLNTRSIYEREKKKPGQKQS
jgi:hypothetical protein